MLIKSSDPDSIKPLLDQFYLPSKDTHKGQNGKVLVIGGSSLFHAAAIWAAETASHFVDIVHYASTAENEEIFLSLKKKFINGIIVKQQDLKHYIQEDDAILIGPGMVRGDTDESAYTYSLTQNLIKNFPDKKFVFDAGSLQMMESKWLLDLKQKPILTPHQLEFEKLFKQKIKDISFDDKIKAALKISQKYRCVVMLKAIKDIITDGKEVVVVEGGNAGLTKGGTGDVLAGLATALYAKNNPVVSATFASYLLKKASDELFKIKGYWYNIDDIINKIPEVLKELL